MDYFLCKQAFLLLYVRMLRTDHVLQFDLVQIGLVWALLWFHFPLPKELLCNNKPSEVVNALHRDYNINDDYAVFTIYGLNSFSYLGDENSPIDYDEIVNYILDNEDDCGYSEIAEILEEEDEEE